MKISGKKPNTSLMLSENVARKSEAAEKRPITFWQVKFVCVCVFVCTKKAPYHHFIHAEYFLVYSSSLLFSSIVFALITHMIRLIGRTCVHFVTSIWMYLTYARSQSPAKHIEIYWERDTGWPSSFTLFKCTQVKMFCLIWVRLVWVKKLAFVWFLFSLSFFSRSRRRFFLFFG